jgi:hypothetical protein
LRKKPSKKLLQDLEPSGELLRKLEVPVASMHSISVINYYDFADVFERLKQWSFGSLRKISVIDVTAINKL